MPTRTNEDPTGNTDVPIAIIGMGCRCPGDATNPETLWKMVSEARNAWSDVPKEKYNADAFYHPNPSRHGASSIVGGHYLKEDRTLFDAPFFNMTSSEAAVLDPQQRLLLEVCYESLENGSDTSCFVGSFCRDFTDIQLRDTETMPVWQATGGGPSLAFLSNRLSYYFDLKGPSVTVDTACSASLVALHLACQTIRSGESKTAIVGGSNVILSHEIMITMSMMGCYSFDQRANGYGRGEGAACVVLKSLDDAIRDGDTIRGVIRNTGINQDGKTAGITLPSKDAQQALISSVYKGVGLDPVHTNYVEAHGTGTPAGKQHLHYMQQNSNGIMYTNVELGDPLEAAAITEVFGPGRSFDNPLRIGSIKSNMGHLEGCSGLAGLIKTVLMLENDLILPNCDFVKGNERIPFYDWKLKVPTTLEPWNTTGLRRASINSFGYGGTNAHLIIDDARSFLASRGLKGSYRRTPSLLSEEVKRGINGHGIQTGLLLGDETAKSRIYTFSSFDEHSGKRYGKLLGAYLKAHPTATTSEFLDSLSFTLNERRTRFPWRAAITAVSADGLIGSLEAENIVISKSSNSPTLAFVFTGQGAQWYGMGRELIQYSIFEESLEKAELHLKKLGASWSLRVLKTLTGEEELSRDEKTSRVSLAFLSQPLCTAIQIALVDLLATWDIKPSAVTGHSSGEIAAAYAAGALTLEDAIAVAYHRGNVTSKIVGNPAFKGAMLAVGMSKVDAEPFMSNLKSGKVSVACENSPSSITVSGDAPAIDELFTALEQKKIFARKLAVEVAYHSHHMTFIADDYLSAMAGLETRVPNGVGFFSSVTGEKVEPTELNASYWVSNMVSQVRFSDSLRNLCLGSSGIKQTQRRRKRAGGAAVDILIELGPHSALAGPIKQILQSHEKLSGGSISYITAISRDTSAVTTTSELACQLFRKGCHVNLSSINNNNPGEPPAVLVDLPPYSWNHSTPLWSESRISKAYRNRRGPRNDLLGVEDMNCNLLEPRWRNIIRPSEIPWVRDHKVQSQMVYPAAGFMIMAIEAACQRAHTRAVEVAAYKLRDISIGQALLIPEYQPEIETMLSLRPYNESSKEVSSVWDEFCVFSVTDDNIWTEHCRGLVSVEAKNIPSEVDSSRQAFAQEAYYAQIRTDAEAICVDEIDTKQLYEKLTAIGLEYGPTFANMTKTRAGPNHSVATVKISDIANVMPMNFQFPAILHPSTLDACFHPLFTAIAAAEGPLTEPMVPTFIEEIVVSAKVKNEAGHEFSVYASSEKKDVRQHRTSMVVFNQDQEHGPLQPMIEITGLVCTALALDNQTAENEATKNLCFQMDWRPDVDFLSMGQVQTLCAHLKAPEGEEPKIEALEQAGFYLMERALKLISLDEVQSFHEYHKKLWTCMNVFCTAAKKGTLGIPTSSWVEADEMQRADVISRVSASGAEGSILCHVGESLPSILRKEVEPLAVMVEENRLDNYYAQNSRMSQNYRYAATYIDLLAHKNPHLKVLEIGAGTGGATLPILDALGGSDGSLPRFINYDFTDVSSGFFENSKEKLKQWGNLITFRKLDIEKEPVEQGYEAGTYDLVIAANVLHATTSMDKTMTHVRKLLKPGGKLCLIELTRERMVTSTVFGTLSGWWAGKEESRQKGPTLTEPEWNVLLQQTGFSGIEAAVWDMPTEFHHQGSMMISSAVTGGPERYPDVTIIVDDEGPEPNLSILEASLKRLGVKTIDTSKFSAVEPKGLVCIVLSETAQHYIHEPSVEQFAVVKNILLEAKGVLWIVRDATIGSKAPTSNLITGLTRTVRSENGGSEIVTLDLDSKNDVDSTESIVKIFKANFALGDRASEIADVEYAERNDQIVVPRLIENKEMNNFIAMTNKPPVPADHQFSHNGRALIMEVGTPGLLDTLHFIPDHRMDGDLPDHSVEIAIKATGLNFRDVMMAMGQIKVEALGGECSGIIASVGKSVRGLKEGDRVVTYGYGTFSNYLRQEADAVQLIPGDMSFEVATTLPIIYCTAYHSVFKAAKLECGETVLIHAASGGLGQALIMLCQMIGAEIFATVGTLEKKEFLVNTYNIPEDHIFSSRDNTFARGVMMVTGGKGVDVIMNSVAGDALRVTWNCIAPFGRFIELGKRDFGRNTRLEMGQFAKNVTFAAVDFIHLSKDKAVQTAKMWAKVMNLIRQGTVSPPQPITVYGMSEAEKALRVMQAGKHIGKLVLMAKPDEIVKAIPRDTSHELLRSDASYLLVGGLGGIGRAMATWMLRHGAKNLIFASRSGLAKQSARDVVDFLRSNGAKVSVFNCDISNAEQVQHMINQSEKEMPPIRGVIQGAMVLKDNLFQNMSIEDYNISIRPKVHGTWNLHRILSKDNLDFFIMLSSTSGIIGNPSQAQYAAASTFLDAFADYRNGLGLPAVTLDLGVILDVGYVAENEKIMRGLEKLRFEGLHEAELMAMIKSAIVEPLRKNKSGQTVTGLGTWQPDGSQPAFSYPMFSHFRRMALKSEQIDSEESGLTGKARDYLRQATSLPTAAEQICMCIIAKMSSLLMIATDDIHSSRPMSDYGIDSLVAVEIRNWLFREMDAVISILELLANNSLLSLSTGIVKRSKLIDPTLLVKAE
ncbi:Reducing polyketide synthase [Lachnellula suecica]|uniref:Reducing polyketide synthase n=1 Tax=Lachnellula suecica TaxID=602035 RepID=A0A8T9CJI6_9HELO|nr:Reducing polyketide synthase [Lachnellula suecica]